MTSPRPRDFSLLRSKIIADMRKVLSNYFRIKIKEITAIGKSQDILEVPALCFSYQTVTIAQLIFPVLQHECFAIQSFCLDNIRD